LKRIEIYTSKKKSIFLLVISIVFVLAGIWLFLEADNLTGRRARNPIFNRGIAVATILFFGFGIFVGIKRLVKSEIALIIDTLGLNLNPKKSLTEFIKWEEILGFDEIKIKGTKILIIKVKNPNYWLENETKSIRRKIMKININTYTSPFNISAASLDISSNALNEMLNNYFEEYKNKLEQE